jgi:hypothetical protein
VPSMHCKHNSGGRRRRIYWRNSDGVYRQVYEHRNTTIEIAPSVLGLAAIYDRDILIYRTSQLMAKKNAREPLAQTLARTRMTCCYRLTAKQAVTRTGVSRNHSSD